MPSRLYLVAGNKPSTAGPVIATSPNAATWTEPTVPGTIGVDAVIAGGPRFVAPLATSSVSDNYLHSVDAVTWTVGSTGTTTSLRVGVYGGDRYVAIASNGNSVTSTDGLAWAVHTGVLPTGAWREINYWAGLFVAVGPVVAYSADGITWTTSSVSAATVAYGRGVFVATGQTAISGEGDPATTVTATSPDMVTWTPRNSFGGGWSASAYSGGFLVLGQGFNSLESPTTFTIRMSSPDGVNWTYSRMQSLPLISLTLLKQLVGGRGRFVYAPTAQNPDSTISVSSDGVSWSTTTFTDRSWRGIALFDPGRVGGGWRLGMAWGSPVGVGWH